MTDTIDPDTYWVFLQVLACAPRATEYYVEISAPNDHGLHEIHDQLPGRKFDQLPWDGDVGDITGATWNVSGLRPVRPGKLVWISLICDSGIYVDNPYGSRNAHAVGRRGVMPGNTPTQDLRSAYTRLRHTVDSGEAMLAKTLEILLAGSWSDANCPIPKSGY